VVLVVAGEVAVVPDTIVDVLPLQVCAVSFHVPLQDLIATVPALTPTIAMVYVVPTRLSVPAFVTVMYCGVEVVTEMGKVITVLDDVAFHDPDVTVCVAEAPPVSPA
jgi:hypothetical protein